MRVLFLLLMTMISSIPEFCIAGEQNNTMVLQQGLMLKLKGSRSAAFLNDPVEKMLVQGTWSAPHAGDLLFVKKDTLKWTPMSADSNGWFANDALPGSYVYCSLQSDKEKIMLLEQKGNDLVYLNGALRTGNRYGVKDAYEDWEPKFNYSILPVDLRRGRNEFLFYNTRTDRIKAVLKPVQAPVSMHGFDNTLPDFLVGEMIDAWGALVVINAQKKTLSDARMEVRISGDVAVDTPLPLIQAMTVRKVGFRLKGQPRPESGKVQVDVRLFSKTGEMLDHKTVELDAKQSDQTHKRTFVSKIDGSVQYYAVNPARSENKQKEKALVLSVHGAGVEAINQANSYNGKTWAFIVSPTNRRPFGFNWEDWGRIDALEVLELAQKTLPIDPERIYLTGHSMGGHGAWHIGAMHPDRFAAIGPSAGWISFWSYRVRDDQETPSPMQEMLTRSSKPSRTTELAENYKQLGIYILHGGADDNVRPDQAQRMVEHLKPFHHDFYHHEEPGQGHWWDLSDEPGTDCVDWPAMFDFFSRHCRPEKERIRKIEFITANPGISAQNNWLSIEAQIKPLMLSKVAVQADPGQRRFVGHTENVARLAFDLSVLPQDGLVQIHLDEQPLKDVSRPEKGEKLFLEKSGQQWKIIPQPDLQQKGPHRNGTFKDAFNNRVIFVYGTHGDQGQNEWAFNKARYDAEYLWYQGNGSVDVLADDDFDPAKEPDRNVVIYGNSQTNSAWKSLLSGSPIQVFNAQVMIGDKKISGKNLSCLFVRPRPNSVVATVGVVSGTGVIGMRMTNRRPYLSPGFAYPDFVFSTAMLDEGDKAVQAAGFFGLDWKLESGDVVWQK